MESLEAFKFASARDKILEAVRIDLMGPQIENEVLDEPPMNSYITGMLYPADTDISEEDMLDELEFISEEYHSAVESDNLQEDEDADERHIGGFKKQASIGISCYVASSVENIEVCVKWGSYTKEHIKKIEKRGNEEKEVSKTVYVREQQEDSVNIDLTSFKRAATLPLKTDNRLVLHVVQIKLKSGYKMISVHLHNHRDKNVEHEKEYENILFQVELTLATSNSDHIFVPEHICREKELDDEFYYESRAVYARGRGCAATWEISKDSQNASYVKTVFIPDYEINSVSPTIKEFEKNTFSMLYMAQTKNKEGIVKRLNRLCKSYGVWIQELNNSEMMKQEKFKNKGEEIIKKCIDAQNRIQKGINLIAEDDEVFNAFCFMNQAMYMQRSISMYAKKNGKGIPCNIKDFMKDDHSEWRPFQIAFVLLNLEGCKNPFSEDRKNVDLLYFPTGGGKTEAYLGLIAFVIAYRRLTASSESEYEKDGGVTVFLRYTLRLLTTQQRDRLMKLIVAAEMLREKYPELYGMNRISIGFWVGGGVTPNKFDDFKNTQDNPHKFKDAMRKVTKQVIVCPCCGTPINYDDYEVDLDNKAVKIFCSNNKCHFYRYNNRTLPVYLVDEEIYRKCPTVVIATVDKFARLPWSESTGLLFGNSDRYCQRCGYLAKGEEHVKRHNKTDNLPKAEVIQVKQFYPPELIIQDELHLITGPLGTIYGGYEDIVEEMCSFTRNGIKVLPKYIVSTATIKNAKDQIRCLYGRNDYTQFPPSGFDIRDSYFIREISLQEKPFRRYVGICGNGQSVKTTLLRTYAIILEAAFQLSRQKEYEDFIDPYYTLIGYFNSIRELGGTVRLLDDDIKSRIERLQKKYGHELRRFINRTKEITSRMPSYDIAKTLDQLTIGYNKDNTKQDCYDVVIATNMIAVGMDVDRLGLMTVVGQPKQNAEYIQATSRVGRSYPGLVFTIYNPYRPRDLSHYENFEGFHSQMYRYVEGTTATPFSARARDRVLHAIVVALLRLQNEELANNNRANEINKVSEDIIEGVKKTILERVSVVSPKAYSDVEQEIELFIEEWKLLSQEEKHLNYYTPDRFLDRYNRLLNFYHEYCTPKEKPTLNSMREVEQASAIYYYNKEDI